MRILCALRRWLRSDAEDVVRIVSARRLREQGRLGLRGGLACWCRRIDAHRFAARVRRRLLVGLLLTAGLELLAAVAGSSGRGLWLVLPGALTLTGILASLHGRVEPADAALLLDRQLGLAERLTTALELASSEVTRSQTGALVTTAPSGAASGRMDALVMAEATTAIDDSLVRARAADPSSAREWVGVLGVALLLAGAFALGGSTAGDRTRLRTAANVSDSGRSRDTPVPTPGHGTADSRARLARSQAAGGSRGQQPRGFSQRAVGGHQSRSTASGASAERLTSPGTAIPLGADSGRDGAASSSASFSRRGTGTVHRGTSDADTEAGVTGLGGGARRRSPMSTASNIPLDSTHTNGTASPASSPAVFSAALPAVSAATFSVGSRTSSERAGAAVAPASSPVKHSVSRETGGVTRLPIQAGYAVGERAHAATQLTGVGGGERSGGPPRDELVASGASASAGAFIPIPLGAAGVPSSDALLLLDYFRPFASPASLSW